MTTTEPHAALQYRCPFCYADPGEACRTHRGRGADLNFPHSRRIALANPPREKNAQVPALCCTCGALRTVSSDYSRYRDPNSPDSDQGKTEGWRRTQTLKCDACGERTRHALLRGNVSWRDMDEERQRWILGCEVKGWSSDRESARAEYFAQFPRNPYAHHWYVVEDAQAAWDAGDRTVTSLCGEPMTLHRDPKTCRSKDVPMTELVEPEEVRDMEYEDEATGLWWEDMTCVNCLRVTNERRRARRLRVLEALLAWFARHPESIPDDDATDLLTVLEPLADQIRATQDT